MLLIDKDHDHAISQWFGISSQKAIKGDDCGRYIDASNCPVSSPFNFSAARQYEMTQVAPSKYETSSEQPPTVAVIIPPNCLVY